VRSFKWKGCPEILLGGGVLVGAGPGAVGVGAGGTAVSKPVGVGYVCWVEPGRGEGEIMGEIVGSGVGEAVGEGLGPAGPGVGQVMAGDSPLGPGVGSAEGDGSTGGRGHRR